MAKFSQRRKDQFDADIANGSLKGSLGLCDTCIDETEKMVYVIGAVASMCEFCLTHDSNAEERKHFVAQKLAVVAQEYEDNKCPLCHGTGRKPWPNLPKDAIPEGSFSYRGYEIRPSTHYESDKYECRDPHYPQIFPCGNTMEEAYAIIDERIAHPRAMA